MWALPTWGPQLVSKASRAIRKPHSNVGDPMRQRTEIRGVALLLPNSKLDAESRLIGGDSRRAAC